MSTPASTDNRYEIGAVLYANDFTAGLGDFQVETEKGGVVETRDGVLRVDVPAGCSVWLKRKLEGPILIEYEVTFVIGTNPDDRLSDLNLFWMSSDARNPADFFAVARTGKFADYNQLRCYYAAVGGNANTTTRFRRYIGDAELRPMLPEHDLASPDVLLQSDRTYRIRAVACGSLIQLFRDDRKLFEMIDPEPYTAGYFALRTVTSHQQIRNFKIHRLIPQ
jgi:hypothetical protein